LTQFSDIITTREQLREIAGEPAQRVKDKVMSTLTDHCKDFIGRSPFVLIASSDKEGRGDVSPKGDPAGFVKIIDDRTLAIPDRPGNRLADTFENILANPRIGLLFMIPGKKETLRVNGTVMIVRDEDLRQSLAINGRVPLLALVVHVEEAYFHCSRCMVRSALWQPEKWPDSKDLPGMAQIIVEQSGGTVELDQISAFLKKTETTDLY
jgi:hypothetical protein